MNGHPAIYGAGFEGLSCFEHDGSKRWTFTPDGRTLHLGVPSILDDSGDARWKALLKGDRAQGTMPTVTDGAVNLLRSDEENITMYSLNAVDGKTTWQISRKGNRGRGPIPARDTIVFTTQYTSGNQGGAITVSEGEETTSQLWAFNV